MWETIRGYLTFTRKERFGVLFLLVLIAVLFVLPYVFRPVVGTPDPSAYERMKDGIRKFESGSPDSTGISVRHDRYPDRKSFGRENDSRNFPAHNRSELFYFDPNMLQAKDWKRLGLSDRLVQTILRYIDKGGRFRRPEDLQKLYGLHDADYARLLPYVHIAKGSEIMQGYPEREVKTAGFITMAEKSDSFLREHHSTAPHEFGFGGTFKKFEVTDINEADSAGWSRLPGIGMNLASRIVHFRSRLGGFYQVEQVGETFGLPDSSFRKIKPYLRMNGVSLHQIDLNNSTREMLASHPYIRWQIAKRIVDYRQQHGGFQSVDELLQLAQMDSATFEKIKPYLRVAQ
jgi:competence protein ComEA